MGTDSDEMRTIDATQSPPMTPDLPQEVGYCWQCGYDLRGLERGVCPECGFRFDLEAVRALNEDWCAQRVVALRTAMLVSVVGCALAVVCMLATHSLGGDLWFTFWGGMLLGIGVIFGVGQWFSNSLNYSEKHPYREVWPLPRVFLLAGIVLLTAPVLGRAWFFGAGGVLIVGAVMNLIQLQSYSDGRRRGRLVGVSESLLESLRFSIGAGKFIVVLSVVLLIVVGIAAGR